MVKLYLVLSVYQTVADVECLYLYVSFKYVSPHMSVENCTLTDEPGWPREVLSM